MIRPVNGHLLIEPLKHESFVSSQRETYEEVGIVVDAPWIGTSYVNASGSPLPGKGDKVYFDSWLAAKFPKNDDEYFWLVKWEDVRAVEHQDVK